MGSEIELKEIPKTEPENEVSTATTQEPSEAVPGENKPTESTTTIEKVEEAETAVEETDGTLNSVQVGKEGGFNISLPSIL